MAFALDLDGVIWLGDEPIPGSAEAVERLRQAGEQVVFCTNNSSRPVGYVEAKLARQGIPHEGAVVTSAMAAAQLIEPGETVLVCAGEGVVEAVERRGARPVREGTADAVVVGLHLDFDYARLRAAAGAIRGGARFIATNDDATYPTPEGLIPGGGAIVAAVATACGSQPLIAGKPHAPMADLIRQMVGPEGTMVGDRPETDGLFAAQLGYRFGLVLSGVTTDPSAVTPAPDLVAPDLATLVESIAW